MFPKNVIGSSSESNATITLVDRDARAGGSAIGALSARAGVSAIGARSLAGDFKLYKSGPGRAGGPVYDGVPSAQQQRLCPVLGKLNRDTILQ